MDKDIQGKLLKVGIAAALLGGGWYFTSRMVKNSNAVTAEKALDNSPDAQQASQLFALLRPNDNVLFDTFTPIDQPAIVAYAKGITNFDSVAKYYTSLTRGKSLSEDLRTTLSAAQNKQFYDNLPKSGATKLATTIIANQRDSKGNTIKGGTIYAFGEAAMKTHPFIFTNNTVIGDAVKKVTVKMLDKNGKVAGYTTLYYVQGTTGAAKGKLFYVLASQVTAKQK